ncbi:MAG: rod shape-determining protein MreC, partial [Flavobacteriales bacterium]|nr:rod shape-determining protein MreC [Flavobacteriales bacterium]
GVVTENGVIGIISTTSKNYSKAISILNQTSSISILHLKSKQNGSLIWTGNDYRTAEINDIPNHADLLVGDTIVTNGFSSIFPEGIKIATIKTFEKGNENGLYSIKVNFINDMNTSKHVYIINSLNKSEKDSL